MCHVLEALFDAAAADTLIAIPVAAAMWATAGK